MIAGALDGNERFISDMFRKLFPNPVHFEANVSQKRGDVIEKDVRALLEQTPRPRGEVHASL